MGRQLLERWSMELSAQGNSIMVPNPAGRFVRHDEASTRISELEAEVGRLRGPAETARLIERHGLRIGPRADDVPGWLVADDWSGTKGEAEFFADAVRIAVGQDDEQPPASAGERG